MTSTPCAFTDPSKVAWRKVEPLYRGTPSAIVSGPGGPFGTQYREVGLPVTPPPSKSATRQHRCRRTPSLSARGLVQRRASPTCKPQSSRVLSSDQVPRAVLSRAPIRPGCALNRPTWSPVKGSSARVSPNRLSYGCPTTIFGDPRNRHRHHLSATLLDGRAGNGWAWLLRCGRDRLGGGFPNAGCEPHPSCGDCPLTSS
jgi:hypothetical protein